MPPIWKPQPPEVLKSWVDAIMQEASDDLSDWETKFIENINARLIAGKPLSQAQEETLEKIYAEKTS